VSDEREEQGAIQVRITDESVAHCLKIVFHARNAERPLEIYLHTTQAIDLAHKLSLTICELHHRDSALLLRLAARQDVSPAKEERE
jgi:hypothetical protein